MIPLSLSGKTALVCGSTQGMGRAIAEAFAHAGANVILMARNPNTLHTVLGELPRTETQHHATLCADFSDINAVQDTLQDYMAHHPDNPIHILVNNTGGPKPGAIVDATTEQFMDTITQHVLVSHTLVQVLLPAMKTEQYGRIINVISTSVKQPIPNLGVSNTTRGAMASWAKTLAMEVAYFGITVNNILPGYIATGRLASLTESIATRQEQTIESVQHAMLATIPAGRFGEPIEAGYLAAFLASPMASYITGTSIALDGGRTTAL